MSGGGAPECPPDQVEPFGFAAGVRLGASLADAPILLIVLFHRTLRAEIAELRRLVESAADGGRCGRELVLDLLKRFEFLKLVFKCHCAAEEEVIFITLDAHIKNVVCTYSLEHKSMEDLFDPIIQCLNVLMEKEKSISKPLQEIVSCISIIQMSICQHMLKEEEQIFPLLMQQFSSEEQASLVWQFLCNVPIMLLEVFLPWMISFLSPDERVDVIHCIKEIVPKEKLLQEVVIYWLDTNNQPSGADNRVGKEAQCLEGSTNKKRIFNLCSSNCSLGDNLRSKESYCPKTSVTPNPVDGLQLWHDAIRKDLKEILEELYQIRSSSNFSNLASLVVQLKFLADVLVFYIYSLDKFFYPVLSEFAYGCSPPCNEQCPDESLIDGLHKLLLDNTQHGIPLSMFVEKLCCELETSVFVIGKHFAFQETKVIPVISKNCNHEMQQQILYMSLHEMPLGLLKCAITWFSARLSEEESRLILSSIKQRASIANKSFASLLHKWFCIGYSGKTSVQRFRKDLQEMFKSRCSFLSEQIDEATRSSSHSNLGPCKGYNPGPMKPISANKGKNCVSYSSSGSHSAKKYDTSYSSGLELHTFFPGTLKIICPLPRFLGEHSDDGSILSEPKPMDLIFFFHKALKKDLEYLVLGSAQLADNVGFLVDFRRRFHLLQFLYQIHSNAEDEVAFPALQEKGMVQNISHSYTIDHKLEVKHFNNISLILYELAELHVSVSIVNFNTLDQRMLKHHKLCMKLHDMCRSMHKVLSDHIQREEIELWPLFRECFSIEEQKKIIGCMLGRMGEKILQEMIPWLMASLTPEEQHVIMSLWRKTAKNTKFDEWLGEWWEDVSKDDIGDAVEEVNNSTSWSVDPLEVVSSYLSKDVLNEQEGTHCNHGIKIQLKDSDGTTQACGNFISDDKAKVSKENQHNDECSECTENFNETDKKRCNEVADVIDQVDERDNRLQVDQKLRHQEHLFTMSQEDLEAAIQRVSRDSSLDPQKKSYIIQNLLMSRWIATQQKYHSKVLISNNVEEIIGQCPSYWDPLKLSFGCKHYKRNCKLFSACCKQLFTCRHCHDEVADHSMDRKSITQMMCMKCLIIQPTGATCSTLSCNNLSMARYYCRICKLYDDEREIYHCPYCNLCRVGKGLGIDYFHCMNCNACMSRSLSVHVCREKCFEDNCPICHEYIFTSCSPIKALPCGHLMHSKCFQDYTCTHYTCPICSKSLGDMQVYFKMLDALLAEEKIPEEYSGQTQFILCNDCEKRGAAPFHWLHRKCSYCGSYNTRLL